MAPSTPDALPLPALLSAAFVAFTVEADNAFERQLPHRTTSLGVSGGAAAERGGGWLASLAMWFNCVRGLSDGPLTVAELKRRVRMGANLDGMRRVGAGLRAHGRRRAARRTARRRRGRHPGRLSAVRRAGAAGRRVARTAAAAAAAALASARLASRRLPRRELTQTRRSAS